MDLYEFETSRVYRVSSRTARAIQRIPVSKKKKKELLSTYYPNKTLSRINPQILPPGMKTTRQY